MLFLIAVSFFAPLVPEAHATVPSWDVAANGILPTFIPSAGTGFETCIGYNYKKDFAEQLNLDVILCTLEGIVPSFDGIAWILAKSAVYSIKQSLMQWIRSGFEGKPLFVQDPNKFFKGFADQASAVFIEDIGKKIANDPKYFCKDFLPKFVIETGKYGQQNYFTRNRCTLSNVIENVDDYYNDFNKGNWRAFVSMQQTNNNPYGLYLDSLDEEQRKRADASGFFGQSAQYGGGYLPKVTCKESNGAGCKTFSIQTPSRAIGDRVGQMVGTDFNELISADELSEVVSAVIDVAIQKTLDNFLN